MLNGTYEFEINDMFGRVFFYVLFENNCYVEVLDEYHCEGSVDVLASDQICPALIIRDPQKPVDDAVIGRVFGVRCREMSYEDIADLASFSV